MKILNPGQNTQKAGAHLVRRGLGMDVQLGEEKAPGRETSLQPSST